MQAHLGLKREYTCCSSSRSACTSHHFVFMVNMSFPTEPSPMYHNRVASKIAVGSSLQVKCISFEDTHMYVAMSNHDLSACRLCCCSLWTAPSGNMQAWLTWHCSSCFWVASSSPAAASALCLCFRALASSSAFWWRVESRSLLMRCSVPPVACT